MDFDSAVEFAASIEIFNATVRTKTKLTKHSSCPLLTHIQYSLTGSVRKQYGSIDSRQGSITAIQPDENEKIRKHQTKQTFYGHISFHFSFKSLKT